jgi:myo-inositol-1(or 4)-monophosphatase
VNDYLALLPPLQELVRQAGDLAIKTRQYLTRQLKGDGSIVTNADELVENFLRTELTKLLPGSTVWGEEFGFSAPGESGLWLVDPIDGTSNFSFGSPLWGVSVGFYNRGYIEMGCVFLPDLDELYSAVRGNGVTFNGTKLPRIPAGAVRPEELVSYYGEKVLKAIPNPPGKMRCAGAFVVDGCFVASQRYRGLIGIREKLYDIAPCVLFGEELCADIRYADGQPFRLDKLLKDEKIEKPWIIFPSQSGFVLSGP